HARGARVPALRRLSLARARRAPDPERLVPGTTMAPPPPLTPEDRAALLDHIEAAGRHGAAR
ncbi:MAG TPA: hypothetical protein VNN07_16145, partial [Candidatus Tectomicrobia bacterium]|nr:hypothetical protein [Candidatus Tectomicrobia bacterium]